MEAASARVCRCVCTSMRPLRAPCGRVSEGRPLRSGGRTSVRCLRLVVPPLAHAPAVARRWPHLQVIEQQLDEIIYPIPEKLQAAQAAATQAMFQNQGFPPAAARQAAQTFVAGPTPATMDNKTAGTTEQSNQGAWPNSAVTMQNMQNIIQQPHKLPNHEIPSANRQGSLKDLPYLKKRHLLYGLHRS